VSLSGFLLFDKPSGWTSHDAAQFFRVRMPGKPKIGHTGTLDPLATGLLVLLVGSATRRQAEFQKEAKTYGGSLRLGVETSTGDMDGEVRRSETPPAFELARLRERAAAWVGRRTLPAPAFSAVKHKGKPLYYYARKGVEVPRKDREMEVYRWELLSYEPPELAFEMDVASGTYVRAVGEALGADLGCGAAVSMLRRTRVGAFRVEDALNAQAARALTGADIAARVRPLPPLTVPA
jgi:tRNA pseudouridine55 synthase